MEDGYRWWRPGGGHGFSGDRTAGRLLGRRRLQGVSRRGGRVGRCPRQCPIGAGRSLFPCRGIDREDAYPRRCRLAAVRRRASARVRAPAGNDLGLRRPAPPPPGKAAGARLAGRVPFRGWRGSGRYWLPYGIGTPARIMTSLPQAQGWQASLGPATTQRVAQTQILDGAGGSAAATVAWLQDYFGGTVVTVAAPASGPTVTVLLGSDFTLKTFPAPAR